MGKTKTTTVKAKNSTISSKNTIRSSRPVKTKKTAKSKVTRSNLESENKTTFDNLEEAAIMLNREAEEANNIIVEQNKVLAVLEERSRETNTLLGEMDRIMLKNENDDLPYSFSRQAGRLSETLDNIEKYSEDLEQMRALREENKALKYKMEISSINQHDEALNAGNKLANMKGILGSEMSQFSKLCIDLGYNIDTSVGSSTVDDIQIPFFFKNVKHLLTHIHRNNEALNEELAHSNQEKLALQEEIKGLKAKLHCSQPDVDQRASEFAASQMKSELPKSQLNFEYNKNI